MAFASLGRLLGLHWSYERLPNTESNGVSLGLTTRPLSTKQLFTTRRKKRSIFLLILFITAIVLVLGAGVHYGLSEVSFVF